jgi:hypothetical protein
MILVITILMHYKLFKYCVCWKFCYEIRNERDIGINRHQWKDNIKMDLKEKPWQDVGWFHLAQRSVCRRSLVKTMMSLLDSIHRSEFLEQMTNYRLFSWN